MLRVQDVIDKYNPDLLYFDDACDWPDPNDWGASNDSSLSSTLLSREDQ